MRSVFINHCHPDMPHVCAVRLREFANALARQGDRIVLLTGALDGEEDAYDPETLDRALASHDWSSPFRLSCRPVPAPVTEALQMHRLPPVLSQAVVLWCFLAKAGVFWNWTEASRKFWPTLAKSFGPDVVWATFGNTDSLNIARGLAGEAGCPWVMDIKDTWHGFVPSPLRGMLARRYQSAASVTLISDAHGKDTAPWFRQHKTVIHSGIPERFIQNHGNETCSAGGKFRLMLTGGVYNGENLRILAGSLRKFLDRIGMSDARDVVITYAGNDHELVGKALQALSDRCQVEINRFIPLDDLRRLQQGANVNIYLKAAAGTVHHKLLELLTIARPILCFPAETPESMSIVEHAHASFHNCRTSAEIARALDEIWQNRELPAAPVNLEALSFYSWEHQAGVLRDVLCG